MKEHTSLEHDCGLQRKHEMEAQEAVHNEGCVWDKIASERQERDNGEKNNKLWKHNGPAGRRDFFAWVTRKDSVIHRTIFGE